MLFEEIQITDYRIRGRLREDGMWELKMTLPNDQEKTYWYGGIEPRFLPNGGDHRVGPSYADIIAMVAPECDATAEEREVMLEAIRRWGLATTNG